ncbi:UNVERIFIED_CONTAM: hypothetical protein HDU68_011641 [Siphonaria sp. JEL0065]|nr:hypothetical protein HDU68_011641 [Siphonaria sp. JEL0065]
MSWLKTLHFSALVVASCGALSAVGYIVMQSTRGDEKVLAQEIGKSPRITDEQRQRNQAILDMIKNSKDNANDTPVWRK